VADASVLPSAGAVNTGLTIMALALRAADDILESHAMMQLSPAKGASGSLRPGQQAETLRVL